MSVRGFADENLVLENLLCGRAAKKLSLKKQMVTAWCRRFWIVFPLLK